MRRKDIYIKLIKIFAILFFFVLCNLFKYKIPFGNQDQIPFKEPILLNSSEIHNNINQSNLKDINNSFSKSLNLENNTNSLSLAKKYYNISEYYMSLKTCELYIESLQNNKSLINYEIYELMILNYIKMFDLEKAKEVLGYIQGENKNYKDLQLLIEQEENKNKENIKKYKQYPFYLNFMRKLYKNGIFMNKMEISFVSENYRFCRATENIYKKELLLKIPLESLITINKSRESEIGKYFTKKLESKLHMPRNSLLTVFLMNEIDKGNQSKWEFYFDFLPSSYDSFPLFYKEKEYEYLKGTLFLGILENYKKIIKEDYDLLIKSIPGFEKYNLNYFSKILEVISSRVFSITIQNKKNTVIAPFADLLNHKIPPNTYWGFDNKINSFYIKSKSNITKGVEVFDSYGIKRNNNYLLYYGFTVNNNTYNKISIRILLKLNNDQCFNIKQKLLGKNNSTITFILGLNLLDKNVQNFFYNLRLISYGNPNCYIRNQTYQILKKNKNKPFSIKNEKKVFEKVREIMTNYIKNYPTTLDYDVKYFEENKKNMDFNQYNCYVIRIGEKEILNFYLNMANYILKILNSSRDDIKILYNKLNSLQKDKFKNKTEHFDEELFKYKDYLKLLFPLLNN